MEFSWLDKFFLCHCAWQRKVGSSSLYSSTLFSIGFIVFMYLISILFTAEVLLSSSENYSILKNTEIPPLGISLGLAILAGYITTLLGVRAGRGRELVKSFELNGYEPNTSEMVIVGFVSLFPLVAWIPAGIAMAK